MIKTAFISAALLMSALPLMAAPRATLSPFESDAVLAPDNPIDKLVLARLEKLGIQPARVCSDAAFVRRVYLDAVGTLPTAREAKEFLLDPNPDKRRRLIDRLLETEEFADYWAMKWSDLLRVKAEFPINLWPNAVQGYHHWIRSSLKQNKPYDRFVRELLTASGSSFRAPEVNFYRAVQNKDPQGVAQAVALTFMGTRAEKWPKEQLAGMAAFFSRIGRKHTAEWKEEIILFDLSKTADGDLAAVFPDGTGVKVPADVDPREVFAEWLIAPKNPWFARNIVNRQWSWLLGRGIIHEPDDIRPDNPAGNPELLAYLEQELVAAKYDLKQVFRLILNSRTYQLASVPRSDKPEAKANFAYYPLRRLEAEVLIDALCQITGTTEKYSSPIPEPFTFIPESQRTIALADGSTTSSFLEMFGRPPRDNGLESERNNHATPAQRLHFLNSSHIQRKIEQGRKLQSVIQSGSSLRETAAEIYLTILSRQPTEEELKTLEAYAGTGVAKGREVLTDLAWTLFNSSEFLYRH
ncbi:MAG: DUF1553 domain-containing protein [Tepidisphaeraceae bacterium]|jgi:hypothetical protein